MTVKNYSALEQRIDSVQEDVEGLKKQLAWERQKNQLLLKVVWYLCMSTVPYWPKPNGMKKEMVFSKLMEYLRELRANDNQHILE